VFYILLLLVILSGIDEVHASSIGKFETERARFLSEKKCKDSKTTPAQFGFGRLYGCITGRAQTAKYFINEVPGTKRVENIKIMWNDWFVDIGYGLHADQTEADELVRIAAKLYAPELKDELLNMMRQNSDKTVESKGITFRYTFSSGPKINERLITISPK
jgi:hypothetical protein